MPDGSREDAGQAPGPEVRPSAWRRGQLLWADRDRPGRVCTTQTAAPLAGPSLRARDWIMAGSLMGSVIVNEVLPGFDYAAFFVFIVVAGLWWRGRLPSFERVASTIGRHFERN